MIDLLLFLIIIFLIILLTILLIPINLDFEICSFNGKEESKYYISWCLLRKEISGEKKEEKNIEKRNKKRKLEFKSEFLDLIEPGIGIIKEASGSLSIKECTISINFGTSNPAHTGMIFGYLSALQYTATEIFPKISITLSPDFSKERFDYYSKGSLTIKQYLLIISFIKFGLRRPIRNLVKSEISRKITIHRFRSSHRNV